MQRIRLARRPSWPSSSSLGHRKPFRAAPHCNTSSAIRVTDVNRYFSIGKSGKVTITAS